MRNILSRFMRRKSTARKPTEIKEVLFPWQKKGIEYLKPLAAGKCFIVEKTPSIGPSQSLVIMDDKGEEYKHGAEKIKALNGGYRFIEPAPSFLDSRIFAAEPLIDEKTDNKLGSLTLYCVARIRAINSLILGKGDVLSVKNWLELISDQTVKAQALANCGADAARFRDASINSISDAIYVAFSWASSPEGGDYWLGIYKKQNI